MPELIREKSAEFIVFRVGQDFFDRYITYERGIYYGGGKCCPQCTHLQARPRYLLGFRLRIPGKPYVDELIEFTMDSAGDVIAEAIIRGLPDCVTNPEECEFSIDQARAIEIAEQAGLEPGIKEWTVGFQWAGGEFQTYAWSVQNTLSDSGFSPEGRGFTIDTNSGEVLQEYLYGGFD